MNKSLPIILKYLFTYNSNIYKPLSTKWFLLKIKKYRKYVCPYNKVHEIRNTLPASLHNLMNTKT